jgi:hypothetical protein
MAASSRAIYWSAIITQFRRSGLSQAQFCRTRHLSIHSFRKWFYRRPPTTPVTAEHQTSNSHSKNRASARRLPPAFLPVHIRSEPLAAVDHRQDATALQSLEVILSDHRRVRVPVGFNPATLRQLLEVLDDQS